MSRLQYWVNLVNGAGVTGGSALRLWDQLSLDGQVFPGLAQVEPAIDVSFDAPNIKTLDSSYTDPRYNTKLLFKGTNAGKIHANILIWDPVDWEYFQVLIKKFIPKKTTTLRNPWAIEHPACALLGIDQICVIGASIPQIVEQTFTMRLAMVQYFPPAPLLSKFGNTAGPVPKP